MHTPLLVGIFAVFTMAAIGLALFFFNAWLQGREDLEYLLFGICTLALAAMTGLETLLYWRALDPTLPFEAHTLVDLIAVAAAAVIPSLLHFALRYTRSPREWQIMKPVYGLYLIFGGLAAAGQYWAHVPAVHQQVWAWGLQRHSVTPVVPSIWGIISYGTFPVALGTVMVLLGRAYFAGRREALSAFLGSIVLAACFLNDAASGVGLFNSMPLLSAGTLAMAYGVSLTVVARQGRRRAALERRTEELSRRTEELAGSHRELERSQRQLIRSEQLAVVGELAAVIAHEVRNPVAIMKNVLATLRKQHTKDADRELLLEILDEETGRLDQLSHRLRDFSRPVVLQESTVSLPELLERSLALAASAPGVELTVELPEELPTVPGDQGLLRQAFENVVANAVQALGEQGRLSVLVQRRKLDGIAAVVIAFQDDGQGMDDTARAQALAPFFTTRPTGTGLGLPIVARIVEAHGGRIRVNSTLGKGTTVSISLPLEVGRRLRIDPRRQRRISLLP